MKKAIVYDKWLDSVGGGEVVAGTIARLLRDKGYDVTIIGGKQFQTSKIKTKLHIDLHDVKFEWVWNDEHKLKEYVKGADVFFNTSFIDYSYGYAKKNFYYTHFPTQAYMSFKGFIFNTVLMPICSRWVDRVEFVTEKSEIMINRRYGAVMQKNNHLLFTREKNNSKILSFSLFFENFYKPIIDTISINIKNADIVDKNIRVDPHHNIIHFKYIVKPKSDTFELFIDVPGVKDEFHDYPKDRVVLLFPKTLPLRIADKFLSNFTYKIQTRLRAGLYVNVIKRLKSYNKVLANSAFTQKWIMNYWRQKSEIVYPPVELISPTKKARKKSICSIGRFFTLGHGKKQEVMIEAFKKMYNNGYKDWELHLIGSVDINSTDSYAFVRRLQKAAKGYPIRFHLNASRTLMEKIASEATIYWHATGYGESPSKNPVGFEHFGIAPIEAISAGCIPVLYNGGGLPEIIRILNLSNTHLYNTIDELVEKTEEILSEDNSYNYKKVRSIIEKSFSMQAFEKRILEIIKAA